jgi:hypothetical protein
MSVAYKGCQRQAPPIEREGFYLVLTVTSFRPLISADRTVKVVTQWGEFGDYPSVDSVGRLAQLG